MSRVLGIETSCDETGVAMVEDGRRILSNIVASQVALHAPYGGVVPELASRQHTRCITQLTEQALNEAATDAEAVAATYAPGLMGSLLVGLNFGKALAYAWRVPFVPIHHLEGHIYSAFLTDTPPYFPFLALLVSGGHTSLVWCPAPHRYETLGTTRDDAVGESFDKVARLLDLPYPGGPSIERVAQSGDPRAFTFPRAMANLDSLDFSYSGLKTAVLHLLRTYPDANPADVAASFQHAAITSLVNITQRAAAQLGYTRVLVTGGVAASCALRAAFQQTALDAIFPGKGMSTDNGAMIALAGYAQFDQTQGWDLGMNAVPYLELGKS
ncbi:MAG: tRNA (adenosine(37)-N6)-threonylcarbamoyltransferase complex transferase subunit TsaD [Candidatus Hydrogenedentes bacterium]|nr:tRNA (adenosine(37)-N6)-threonylcarbamoyltransferase complex transferase subunit TsaD [Candidatus Hydrogenedentota bacterium]